AARRAGGHGRRLRPGPPQPGGLGHLARAGRHPAGHVRRSMSEVSKETAPTVLELTGVSRQFGAVRALSDVSFECRAGEIHALVGENGSGKSTLLGIASGFVEPDTGTVRIGGKELRTDSPALEIG